MKSLKKLTVVVLALIMVVSVFAACDIKITPQQKILGAWRDSTGTMGLGPALSLLAHFIYPFLTNCIGYVFGLGPGY